MHATREKADIRVLLVEDDEEDYLYTRHLLSEVRKQRYEVAWSDRLQVALNYLKDASVDIILLDLTLPDSYGWETFTAVREVVPDVPVVLLTGLQDEEMGTRALHAGAQDFLDKSELSAELLSRSISYAIERLRAQDALQSAYKDLESLITERTQELAQTNQRLQIEITRRERLEHALREGRHVESICAFVESATHRFSALLGGIRERVDALAGNHTNAPSSEHVEGIKGAASQAAHISSRLAGLTKVVGASEGTPERIAVSKAVRNIVERLSPALAQKGVEVVSSEAGFVGHVYADGGQLTEILTLIIANAPLVLPEGGTLRLRLVECRGLPEKMAADALSPDDRFVVCEALYSGVHMDDRAVDSILNPLSGLAVEHDADVPSGLGFAVVQSRSRGWGGTVAVLPRGELGGGFRVFLPLSAAGDRREEAPASSLVDGGSVLVVDDDEATVSLVSAALTEAGYSVISATNGADAVAMLEQKAVSPVVAILDGTLRGQHASGVLQRFSTADVIVPVLVVSGFSRDYLHSLLPAGTWHFLQKPFEAEEIVHAVDALVRAHVSSGWTEAQ